MIEKPLLVTPKEPEKVVTLDVESLGGCDSAVEQVSIKKIERMSLLDILNRFKQPSHRRDRLTCVQIKVRHVSVMQN